ncbi:MAG: hypothetical protein ACMUIE_02060 [Thermoplasmatota archaeon]
MPDKGIRWFTDTIPHLLTVLTGALVMFSCSIWFGIAYIVVVILGMLWFWGAICTACRAYGSRSCPSGYGMISSRLFKRTSGDFRRAFKYHIFSVAVQWFFPLLAVPFCLYLRFSWLTLVLYGMFIVIAFVYLPFASKGKGCSRCPQRGECPWKR